MQYWILSYFKTVKKLSHETIKRKQFNTFTQNKNKKLALDLKPMFLLKINNYKRVFLPTPP